MFRVKAMWLADSGTPNGAERIAAACRVNEQSGNGGGRGGVTEYRVIARRSLNGDEILIEPVRWCFCRPSFVVFDHGKQIR
jgi:hypothetical protein